MGIIADIRRANNLAYKHKMLAGGKISEWFINRYGIHFSDVDADQLIDAIDYGAGWTPNTIAEIDAVMALSGQYPLLKIKDQEDK